MKSDATLLYLPKPRPGCVCVADYGVRLHDAIPKAVCLAAKRESAKLTLIFRSKGAGRCLLFSWSGKTHKGGYGF